MKKTLLILAVTLISTIGMGQKYGHLNAQEVLKELPEYKAAQSEVERYSKQKQSELTMQQQAFQTEVQNYTQEKATLSVSLQQSREKDLMEMQENIQLAAQKAEQKLAQKEQELLQPMIKKVTEAIKKVGKDNNYTYIFDTSAGAVVYFDGGDDVSELVKKEMAKSTTTTSGTPEQGQ